MQYSVEVLDHLTAPRLSALTLCGATEVQELPDYSLMLSLNQAIGGAKYKNENERIHIRTFISRLTTAAAEYNQGRRFLQNFTDEIPANHSLDAHRQALAHFENCILQLHVAIMSLAALGGGIEKGKVKPGRPQFYEKNDNSDYDRLRVICNSIKHFDETIEKAAKRNNPVPIAPVWISNDGFECIKGAWLRFSEIEAIFEDQAKDAENFAYIN